MPYLFRVVFCKKRDVINRQSAVMCELARQRFSTSPFDGAPRRRKEREPGWTASGKRVTRDSG